MDDFLDFNTMITKLCVEETLFAILKSHHSIQSTNIVLAK